MSRHASVPSRGARRLLLAGFALLVPVSLAAWSGTASAQDAHAQDGHAPKPHAGDGHDHEHAAAPERKVAKVGEAAPDFTLKDVDGVEHKLSTYAEEGKLVVLEWINPDCPISKAYHAPENHMVALAGELKDKGVVWLAINSGAEGKQGAGVERNKQAIEEYGITYPVLMDMDGKVGHAYEAKTTPHMYVIDAKGVLRYAGAIDDGDPRSKGEVNYVRQAVSELLADKPVSVPTSKPFGCSVKYGS